MFKADNLYQNDPDWKDVKLGLQDKETIGTWGCLLTSITMVLNGFGFNETPVTVNDKMKNGGGFQGALLFPYMIAQVFPSVIFRGYDPCETSPAPLERIDAALAKSLPVIVQVDWNPQPGIQTHYVVLYDKDGEDYLMLDPYRYRGDEPGKKLRLTERYKYSGKTASEAITGVIWFEKSGATGASPAQPPVVEKIAVPSDSMVVYASADGLAFRSAASASANLIKRLPLNTELKTLESASVVKPKLGVVNQWLRVQDPGGDQGFIAAWYASDKKQDIEPAPTTPGTGTSGTSTGDNAVTVKPTQEGVAMRSQPVVSDATLIKRLAFTATLKLLEAGSEAKIGKVNEWLKVQDVTGQVGFVAAWYVTLVSNPAVGVRENKPEEKPTPTTAIVVRTTENLLALRQTPAVSGVLIKRLPLRAELVLVDPTQESSIGGIGKWLKVKDVQGAEGWVAAWYVTR